VLLYCERESWKARETLICFNIRSHEFVQIPVTLGNKNCYFTDIVELCADGSVRVVGSLRVTCSNAKGKSMSEGSGTAVMIYTLRLQWLNVQDKETSVKQQEKTVEGQFHAMSLKSMSSGSFSPAQCVFSKCYPVTPSMM
jgi:hypothetical protein